MSGGFPDVKPAGASPSAGGTQGTVAAVAAKG